MARVLVIGCGNVGSVGLHKMAQYPEIFSEIIIVSRTKEKMQKVLESVVKKTNTRSLIGTYQDDISKPGILKAILERRMFDLVVHWGHPYDNLTIMQACLDYGVPYIDTACYEKRDKLGFSYKQQWAMNKAFKRKKLLALTGIGFDPGVTNIFCAYARDYLFDEVHYVDILDCNGGSKDAIFAPNFDPEINLRELILPIKFWENGKWEKRGRIFDEEAANFAFNFPNTGVFTPYMMYHEEMESLVKHMPHLMRIRFWMTFDRTYLTHLRVLHNVGMTGIKPVDYEGHPIVPVKFLKAILPKGEDFNKTYVGNTCIGCIIAGIDKSGRYKAFFIYQVCNHKKAFLETGGNAIGYTTAIPTVTAAKMIIQGLWKGVGVKNVEDSSLNSALFLEELPAMGLPWNIVGLKKIPIQLKKSY